MVEKQVLTEQEKTETKNNNVLCVCSKSFPGVSTVFFHGQKLGLWDFKHIESINLQEIQDYNLIIFGGYHWMYEHWLPYCKQKKAFLITSSLGQIEQSGEAEMFSRMIELLKNNTINYLLVGSKDLKESLGDNRIFRFPYPYSGEFLPKKEYFDNRIGLFCPTHHRKNLLNQIHAFRLCYDKNPELELYTNARIRTYGNVKVCDWLNQKDYAELLGSMSVVLNVFHTESFCYSTIDALMLGVPVIVSQCIKDNLNLPDDVVIKNSDSLLEISKKLQEKLKLSPKQRYELVLDCKERVLKLVGENNAKLEVLLKELLENNGGGESVLEEKKQE